MTLRGAQIETPLRNLPDVKLLRRDWRETSQFHYATDVLDRKQHNLAGHPSTEGIDTNNCPSNRLQFAFATYSTTLSVTDQLFRDILTLPLCVDLSDADMELVIGHVRAICLKSL